MYLFILSFWFNHFSLVDCESLLVKDMERALKTEDHSKPKPAPFFLPSTSSLSPVTAWIVGGGTRFSFSRLSEGRRGGER